MQLTIATWDDRVVTVDISGDDSVDTLKAILEVELGVPAAQQHLLGNGRPLLLGATLAAAGVAAGDVVMLLPPQATAGGGGGAGATASHPGPAAAGPANHMALGDDGSALSPAAFIAAAKANPEVMAQLRSARPRLAQAIANEDAATMQEELRTLRREQRSHDQQLRELDDQAAMDPFNPEVQRRIEELIHKRNIEENLETALENSPEVFAQVQMLYVPMEVNGVPLKVFVDSGAQMTIMTEHSARDAGLLRLMDRRFAGMAVGVGSSRILGRVHQAPLKVAGHFITSSVTVLEQKSGPQFIFGLDMLKRHQCCIDLAAGVLRFGSVGAEVPFLPDHEIPGGQFEGTQGEAPSGSEGMDAAAPSGGGGGSSAPAPPAAAAPSNPAAAAPSNPAPAALAPAAAPQQGGSGGGAADGAALAQLMQLGFDREACLRALNAAGGNPEVAASLLFGGMD